MYNINNNIWRLIMSNKIYKRFPIKLWESECDVCCIECEYLDNCIGGCVKNEITCNQCKHNEEEV